MSDIIDQAQHYDEIYRQSAIVMHFAGRGNRPVVPADHRDCQDCGEEIEEARLDANPAAARCIDCQKKYERIHGRGRV